jgi:hypothetical protein
MKHFLWQNPFYGLSDEQRRASVRKWGERSATEFSKGLSELEGAIKAQVPIELLATAAFYCLYKGVGPESDLTSEGPYPQAVVEVVQSLCLRYKQNEFGTHPALHRHLFQILDLSKECLQSFGMRPFAKLADMDEKHRGLQLAIESARLHTQNMRNWGYPQHVREIYCSLFEPLESEIQDITGMGPIAFLDLMAALRRRTNERVTSFINTIGEAFRVTSLKKMVSEFCRISRSTDNDEKRTYDLLKTAPGNVHDKRLFLMSYFHQFIADAFTFTVSDALRLTDTKLDATGLFHVLEGLSYQFGDLAAENPEHLFMQSKIHSRPFIKITADSFFLPIPGLLNSFPFELVETWLDKDGTLKDRYHKRRAKFLEGDLKSRLQTAFPDAVIKTGTTWNDPDDSKGFENDCLVVCGPLALVVEAKSERIADSARRGAAETLKSVYGTLVNEPAEQAERLAKLLEDGQGIRRFQTKKEGEFELDLSKIRRAICVSITLDWIPATTLCWRRLVESGLVQSDKRVSLNLTLSDLLVVLEVLDSPATLLHYFWRRSEWEAHVLYLGDEMDLLVYYLSTGLGTPKADRSKESPELMLYGNSEQLHRYFVARHLDAASGIPRPRRILTGWWQSTLDRIEKKGDRHRWDILCILLDLSFEQQEEFEQGLARAVRAVRDKGNDCGMNGFGLFGLTSESRGAVIGFAYHQLTREQRNERASVLVEKVKREGAKRIVLFGRDVERLGNPYDFMAYLSPELDDVA